MPALDISLLALQLKTTSFHYGKQTSSWLSTIWLQISFGARFMDIKKELASLATLHNRKYQFVK